MTQLSAAPFQIDLAINDDSKPVDCAVDILQRFRTTLEKRLKKGGREVSWQTDGEGAMIVLRLRLDPGNQMLRYLIPFASPATVEALGEIRPKAGVALPVRERGTANFGLFGGSAAGMLKVAADTAAKKVAKRLLNVRPTGFEPVMALEPPKG